MGSTANWMIEGYVEFGIGVFVILLRIFARSRLVEIKGWQGDDYLILVALAAYGLQANLWKGLHAASSISDRGNISEKDLGTLVYSLKVNLGWWTCNVTYLWCLKGCMIFLYSRITNGLVQYRFVRIAGIVIASTWVLSILELYLHCLPVYKLWQISPNPGKVCSSDLTNFAIIGFFNFATDAMLLCIAIPMLFKAEMLLARRLLVGLLFCGGIFVITTGLFQNINGLLQVYGMGIKDNSMGWAVRGLLVATIVVNSPCTKSLFCSQVWMNQKSGCSGEKRQPLDWDEAESQVMNARVGDHKQSMFYQYTDTMNSTSSWSSDGTLVSDKLPELYTYGVDHKGRSKKVRFSDSPVIFINPDEPSRIIADDIDYSNGMQEDDRRFLNTGGNNSYREEEDLLPAPLRLLTVKNI